LLVEFLEFLNMLRIHSEYDYTHQLETYSLYLRLGIKAFSFP
jgi:hypothetical protein